MGHLSSRKPGSSSRKALRWRDSRNSQRCPCASDTQLDFLKAWCPRRWTKTNHAMRIKVMRGHTKSLDANDKLIQTRSHVRNAIASRERQVVMRKVKSTIKSLRTTCFQSNTSGIVRGNLCHFER